MKKLFLALFSAFLLSACNNAADTTENKKDSLDSVASEKKEMIDSSADVKKDVVDSVTDAKKEALDRRDSLNKKDTTHK